MGMDMRIAIIEDQTEDLQMLRGLLDDYFSTKALQVEYDTFVSGESFLSSFTEGKYQIALLDIYMGGMDGMEIGHIIRRSDPACRIIFCTTSAFHAVESYEVGAAYYLLKPVSYEKLCLALDHCCQSWQECSQYIELKINGFIKKILLHEIYYVDCINRKTQLHLKNTVLCSDTTITEILNCLADKEPFLICNRNLCANMQHIENILEKDFLLDNGEMIPFRQRGKKELKARFLEFSLRGLHVHS